MAGDRLRQPAYEIFSIECSSPSFNPYIQRSLRMWVSKKATLLKVVKYIRCWLV